MTDIEILKEDLLELSPHPPFRPNSTPVILAEIIDFLLVLVVQFHQLPP